MESKLHKTVKLQRRVLEAAALGSVKLLRSLVDSHREYIAKQVRKIERRASREYRKRERRASEEHRKSQQRASKEHRRQNHEYPAFQSGGRHHKKRFRDGAREVRNRGGKRKRKEETYSESGGKDTDDAELPDSEEVLGESSASDTDVKTRGNPSPSLHEIVNARDAQGLTPLHHACYAGSDRAVKYLLSERANVHCRDMRGNTPLHIAAKVRSPSLVSLLQKAGADMEAFNDDGETPSDVVARNEEAKKTESDYVEQQSWYSHLADELSEDEWWGESFSEVPEPQEWESILEMMAEKAQARGLYNDDFVSRRPFIREKKPRKEKKPSEEKAKDYMEEKRSSPEEVNLQKVSVLADTRTYNQRWQNFSKSYNLCLSYADIPFPVPEGKEETLAQVLLHGVDPSLQKDALRKEILKWHPDKFLQKWGPKLQGPDHERIVRRVNEISQALNILYKGIASSK